MDTRWFELKTVRSLGFFLRFQGIFYVSSRMGTCRVVTVASVVVVVGIILKIAIDLQAWQYFEKVQNHSEYTCRPLYPPKKMVSCEDIELDTTTGRAYLPTSDLTAIFKPRVCAYRLRPSSMCGLTLV